MKKPLRIILILAVIGVICGLAIPLLNLVIPLPASKLATLKRKDPILSDALYVLEKKCVHCHTSEMKLPWYAHLPVAKQLMTHDVKVGTMHSDFIKDFFPEDGGPVSEVLLSKIEYTTLNRSMPPPPFLLMHWDMFMNDDDDDSLLKWIRRERVRHHATPGNSEEVMEGALQPLPAKMNVDAKKVALGEELFFDVRLSKDNSVSCASCHALDKGGTDQLAFSVGVDGLLGDINSPTVFNSAFQFKHFWDGRAADLEEQADGPVNNPVEMASNWEEVLGKLNEDTAFEKRFTAVYKSGYSMENIVDAIAAYERTLLTPAPFDAFLKGDESALNEQQQKGYALFNDLGCYTCHTGVILGGKSFERMGLRKEYFGTRGEILERDYGRFNFTGDEYDRFRIKTPTLRNIAETFPYMHDSTVATLEEAVDIMAEHQVGKKISAEENQDIVAFLHSLTGKYTPGAAVPTRWDKVIQFMESFS
ncbi:MAG: c-type cytochrome [Candidatus Hydrogenedentes bacterium]|jgi:cytochrome c peroxidase|nr:c-type cytochrome [Candidatus Hydrogenedentota bacterium]